MTPVRMIAANAAATALLFCAGCVSDRHTEPIAPPLKLTDPVIVRGQQVFYDRCHHCHPHGGAGLGPAIVNKPLPGFLLKIQVRHGLGAMPRFPEGKISADDLDALVRYIKAVHANKPLPENLAGPT